MGFLCLAAQHRQTKRLSEKKKPKGRARRESLFEMGCNDATLPLGSEPSISRRCRSRSLCRTQKKKRLSMCYREISMPFRLMRRRSSCRRRNKTTVQAVDQPLDTVETAPENFPHQRNKKREEAERTFWKPAGGPSAAPLKLPESIPGILVTGAPEVDLKRDQLILIDLIDCERSTKRTRTDCDCVYAMHREEASTVKQSLDASSFLLVS